MFLAIPPEGTAHSSITRMPKFIQDKCPLRPFSSDISSLSLNFALSKRLRHSPCFPNSFSGRDDSLYPGCNHDFAC